MDEPIWHLEWNENLSVDNADIDREHRKFIDLVNDLNRSIADREDLPEIRNKMQLLLEDGKRHFAHEEKILKQHNYPEITQHAQEHRAIIENFDTIMDSLDEHTTMFQWVAAGLRVKAALIGHLLGTDMQYRDHLHSPTA